MKTPRQENTTDKNASNAGAVEKINRKRPIEKVAPPSPVYWNFLWNEWVSIE
ncbi:MAG: hypothetical protein ACFB16_05235 [Phormidesmis sp.]